jgi:hypothetical protein
MSANPLTGDEFAAAYAKAPGLLFKHFESRLEAYGKEFSFGTIVKNRLRGRPGLISHSGASGIKGSFDSAVLGNDIDALRLKVFTTSRYAPIHEFGGVIKARLAKYLWFFWEAMNRWVRAKQVTIPARLGFFKEWETDAPRRDQLYRSAIRGALEEMGNG